MNETRVITYVPGRGIADMNMNEIAKLIKDTPDAMHEAADFAENASNVCGRVGQSSRMVTVEDSIQLLAGYIASAVDWTLALEQADLIEGAKLGARPRGRIGLIEQVERIGEVVGWDMLLGGTKPKLRDRPIHDDVLTALDKKGVLGPALISHLEPPDERKRKDLQFLPLGIHNVNDDGHRVPEEHDGTVFGFHDPSHLTNDEKTNARKLKRKFAVATKFDVPAVLRVDQVSWKLDGQSKQVIEDADTYPGVAFASLKSLRDRLLQPGLEFARKNLAIVARNAARFLEIEFQITDRNRDNQSHETVASWTRPYPFAEFAIEIFEILAPTRNGESLDEIFPRGTDQNQLKCDAVDLVLDGAQNARRILTMLADELRARGYDIEPASLVDRDDRDDDAAGAIDAHYLDRGSPVMRISENRRTTTGRLNEGRGRILEQLWTIRENAAKLRCFSETFQGYHDILLERGGNYGPLRSQMMDKLFYPTLDWYRELGARFEEGVAYKADIKRRAGGLPNEVPQVPVELEHHSVALTRYRASWGAKRDDVVIKAILDALDPTGQAFVIWQEACTVVDDEALGS